MFRRLRHDNLAAAVKRVLRGSRREETARFIAFRSHWRFEAEFCTPARGNEKGGVEGEAGRFRRNHLVPIPRAKDLDELNGRLLDCCRRDEQRTVAGQSERVGERMEIEREKLLGLAEEPFPIEATSFPTVDGSGCVKVRTNFYSTPLRPGTKTQAKIFAETVEVWHEGRCVGRHERSYSRQQKVLDLEHYLEALERKPGALAGSAPLEQWRRQGRWPASYDRLWSELMRRHGKQGGTQQMLGLLEEGKRQGWLKLQRAVEQALEYGCTDPAAVRYLLSAERLERTEAPKLIVDLPCAERALPTMTAYDQLLGQEALV